MVEMSQFSTFVDVEAVFFPLLSRLVSVGTFWPQVQSTFTMPLLRDNAV